MTSSFPLSDSARSAFGLGDAPLTPLAGDASSRRYARVNHPEYGACLVLSDEPHTPHFERFLIIAEHLRTRGFSVPDVFAADRTAGLALVEDLGTATYTRLLDEGRESDILYDLAVDTLAALQAESTITDIDVPDYDLSFLLEEVAILADWFAPATGSPLSHDLRDAYLKLWEVALDDAGHNRETLVLRDFHVDNLILLEDREGIRACGIIDFQGALIGSPAYDLVSLTQDARRDLTPGLEERCIERYLTSQNLADEAGFLRHYHILGAQRHAKVAGIFHRLNMRDGKPDYLKHLPRVLKRLQESVKAAGLNEISAFLDEYVPAWRG